MKINIEDGLFAICKLGSADELADLVREVPQPCFTGFGNGSYSAFCLADHVPSNVAADPTWRLLRIDGRRDAAYLFVVGGIPVIMSGAGVPTFPLSTFDTDYIAVKRDGLSTAVDALRRSGHSIGGSPFAPRRLELT
ncbi:MAG: hypothetical protein LBM23_02405 [Propionibacteriaceae bacterium]|nr:hypothetical protein [Propionibacteriaceae bacterium]